VSYDGLVTAIRSYHPVMANTDYNIILHNPAECYIITNHCSGTDMNPTSVYFENNSAVLSDETKKRLDIIASRMKECPMVTVLLTAHSAYRKSLQKFADMRLDAIKEYLIEQDDISINRIKTGKTTGEENSNSVDVKPE
jgi:outer membrane protein OmpA-like peptidoglycan-associated protein